MRAEPLAHPGEPEPGPRVGDRRPLCDGRVARRDDQLVVGARHVELDGRSGGVLHRVRQRLLDDAERDRLELRRQHQVQGRDDEAGACGPRTLEQRRETRSGGAVGLEHRDQAIGLGQRLDAGIADRVETRRGDVRAPRLGEPSRARLDDDEREVVRDDVVEVPGDPHPLAIHREPDERLLLGSSSRVRSASARTTSRRRRTSRPPHQGGSVATAISAFGASANPMWTWIATVSATVAASPRHVGS